MIIKHIIIQQEELQPFIEACEVTACVSYLESLETSQCKENETEVSIEYGEELDLYHLGWWHKTCSELTKQQA